MLHKKWLLFLTAGLALTVLAVGGCIFSPEPDSNPPVTPIQPYQWPDTADKLMENFERAYSEMNINEYEIILHEDYKFIFIDNVEIWYRQQDITSTTNMFAGNPGQNPDNTFREGVQSIEINTLIRQTPWEDIPANDPDFPNSERALFLVNIKFILEGGLNTITVSSDQEFFVKSEEVDQGDGTTRTRYYLYGQRDLESTVP
ncbi:hypothetical protein KKA85_09130 [bacterium]|nr:hypothetical protein [bacterium]MBU1675928.1 hypothetical protein [bacterium]